MTDAPTSNHRAARAAAAIYVATSRWVRTHRIAATGIAVALVLACFTPKVMADRADAKFVNTLYGTTDWAAYPREQADFAIEFGRGVCTGLDNDLTGVEVYATLLNTIGPQSGFDGFSVAEVEQLMDVAIDSYCPENRPKWTDGTK
jgi:hypothetical protein